MNQDLVDRLRLVLSPGIGPVTYRQLISCFKSPAAALAAVPDLARRGGGPPPRLFSPGDAEREMARVEKFGGRYLALGQMPPGTEPRARHFPYRNRIIAGLCTGTVVVEAAPRSGSLITARLAVEAGREVMAVPGSPLDPRAQGCNQLIRDGATLIQNAADVVEAIRPMSSRVRAATTQFQHEPDELSDEAASTAVEQLLGPSPVPVDEIIRLSGAPSGAVQMTLLELDLAGRLDRHAGNRVSLRPAP